MLRHALVATGFVLAALTSPTAEASPFDASTIDLLAEPAQCPYDGPHPTLRQGSISQAVVHLQCLLRNVWGYSDVVADGIFGPRLRDTVIAHQRDCDIPPNGVVGPETWSRLHPDTTTPECLD